METQGVHQHFPDHINHSAHVWFTHHTGAWFFVLDHQGLQPTVFDVITWIIELIRRKVQIYELTVENKDAEKQD